MSNYKVAVKADNENTMTIHDKDFSSMESAMEYAESVKEGMIRGYVHILKLEIITTMEAI